MQFSLHEKVAMPPTHQMKQRLGQKEQKNGAGDDPVGIARGRRHAAILEEDFIGSDDDGVCLLWLISSTFWDSSVLTLLKHIWKWEYAIYVTDLVI